MKTDVTFVLHAMIQSISYIFHFLYSVQLLPHELSALLHLQISHRSHVIQVMAHPSFCPPLLLLNPQLFLVTHAQPLNPLWTGYMHMCAGTLRSKASSSAFSVTEFSPTTPKSLPRQLLKSRILFKLPFFHIRLESSLFAHRT